MEQKSLRTRNHSFDIGNLLRSYGVLIGLVLIIIVASIVEPTFVSFRNMLNILRQMTILGLCSLGMTYVFMTGMMDLSVGAVVSLGSVLAVSFMNRLVPETGTGSEDWITILIILGAALMGFIVGLANGAIISGINGKLGESFIITYGMQIVVAALALLYSGGQFIKGDYFEGIYSEVGRGYWPIIIYVAIAAVLHFVLKYTKFGRQVSYLGANVNAARMSGIRVKTVRLFVFGICGACAGLAAIFLTSRVSSASPLQGEGYELDTIAAVMIGGTSQTGGSGSIINTVLGVLVISVLNNALNVMGIGSNVQLFVRGVIIVLTVALDMWNKSILTRQKR